MPAVQPAPADMQRRHSSASSDTGSDPGQSQSSRHTSQENVSLIPTRTSKVATSKPAANPLKFVKVGPCDLSRNAQELLKKAEEVKKVKPEKRDEAEDWQSNLDNWKFSRRKRQEHIIERVVEVKKLELEEHDRNRRRSKTFSEMLEERNSKGRKMSLPVYQDDNNDLSDLGLSTSKVNGDDNVFHDSKDLPSTDKEDDSSSCSSGINGDTRPAVNGHSDGGSKERTPEQEEYTYERAIQNYVNFTESRVRGKSLTPSESESSKLTNGVSKKSSPPVPAKPRRGSCKIEEKLSELEQIKQKSMSTNDLTENAKKILSLPKVNILKRREMFEKSQEEETSTAKHRLSGDFSSSKSIRDRVSSLGKPTEDLISSKKVNRLSAEISVKDRLLHIEKQNSVESNPKKSNTLNDNVAISSSAKDRLLALQKSSTVESKPLSMSSKMTADPLERANTKSTVVENTSVTIPKSNQNSNSCRTISRTQEVPADKKEELVVNNEADVGDKPTASPTDDMYDKRQQHYRHRSLDSLDVDSSDGVGNESFERVQSLEDLDFCRNYPASSVSGDTDREDSGIHTADVSSSVSQADDCDSEYQHQPTILEEFNKSSQLTSALIAKQIIQMNVSESEVESTPVELEAGTEEVGENSCGFLKLPLKLDCDPLPVILESPSEPFPPSTLTSITDLPNATCDSSPEPNHSSHNNPPSQSNVTNSTPSDANFVKVDNVNTSSNLQVEQCNVTSVNGGVGEQSPANSILVNTTPLSLSILPVNISPAQVVHDNKTGAVELCHKVDVSELQEPLPNLAVSVSAEYKFEPEEKFEDSLEYKVGTAAVDAQRHLSELTVDVSGKQGSLLTSDVTSAPVLPVFCHTNNSQLIEDIEAVFPLSPSTLEPPKEKPPPPPTEISDDDDSTSGNNKSSVSLRRLDSTKRIKKEIRQKRSSFLGIEGSNDDNYLEPELELVRRPPDITSFLAEEKRLEQMLYRQSICSESESRDSGVELEKHHDDLTWPTVHHSRDNSETYANTSTTSEEEEIMKKEREIIEMLEREEIDRYPSSGQDQDNIGEKLAARLRELEAEKSRLEWEREEEVCRRKAEEAARVEHQSRIQARERQLCKQEEMLMAERERLDAEQAVLARQREAILQQQYNQNRSLTDVRVVEPDYRRSMQDLRTPEPVCYRQSSPPTDNRRSMPNLVAAQPRRPPPPIPPAKPLIIPRTQDKAPQQMTRQTLQALSAAPRSRLNDNWLQSKRKPKDNCNYQQHWLIQEAEQRRITEHHQRQALPPRRPVPPPPPQQNGGWANNSNVQYTNWQPAGGGGGGGGQWGAQPQPRSDKPLPDSIIQTLTQRVQSRLHTADPNNNRRRMDPSGTVESQPHLSTESQEKMLSVSGKKKCSHCGDELGRGAAMIIESLRLFYHIDCFKCCVCCVQLGDGLMGTDVRVRNNKLHCHNCYSSDDGVKFSCV